MNVYTMRQHSPIKLNEPLMQAATRMNLEALCSRKEASHHVPPIVRSGSDEMPRAGQSTEAVREVVVVLTEWREDKL